MCLNVSLVIDTLPRTHHSTAISKAQKPQAEKCKTTLEEIHETKSLL